MCIIEFDRMTVGLATQLSGEARSSGLMCALYRRLALRR